MEAAVCNNIVIKYKKKSILSPHGTNTSILKIVLFNSLTLKKTLVIIQLSRPNYFFLKIKNWDYNMRSRRVR